MRNHWYRLTAGVIVMVGLLAVGSIAYAFDSQLPFVNETFGAGNSVGAALDFEFFFERASQPDFPCFAFPFGEFFENDFSSLFFGVPFSCGE